VKIDEWCFDLKVYGLVDSTHPSIQIIGPNQIMERGRVAKRTSDFALPLAEERAPDFGLVFYREDASETLEKSPP
jgi:hypothetical protein